MAGVFDNTVGMTTSRGIFGEDKKPKEEIKEIKEVKEVGTKISYGAIKKGIEILSQNKKRRK